MNKHTKALMSVLVISMLFVSATPLMTKAWQEPAGADAADWYKTVQGVLSTDKYALYPYEKKDLTIGFSQFGEMIDSITNKGLQYGTTAEPGRDPFAPPYESTVGVMPKYVWLEGWLINITYVHGGKLRNVWATAQHADIDSYEYGNDWVRYDDDYPVGPDTESDEIPYNGNMGYFIGTDPAEYGTGGRVTNGTVVTEPIEVLYDGPRRFVARIVNHVYDWVQKGTSVVEATNVHLVDVIITIDFNKVKKEVQLLKDVKLIPIKGVYGLLPADFWIGKIPEGWKIVGNTLYEWDEVAEVWIPYGPVDIPIKEPLSAIFVQFSNRGQWDLGKPNAYKSYVHFFTEGDWAYDPRDAGDNFYPWWWMPSPVNPPVQDDVLNEGLYTVYGNEYTLTSTVPPNAYSRHGIEPWPPVDPIFASPGVGSTFDVAQIISDDKKYVGWAAYWPSLSDWSVQGIELGQYWKSLASYDVHPIDSVDEPWQSPYIIGEWDFLLSKESKTYYYTIGGGEPYGAVKIDKQFRGVTVYGLTDAHTDAPDVEYFWCDWDGREFIVQGIDEEYKADLGVGLVPVGAAYDDNFYKPWPPEFRFNVLDREVAYQLYEKFRPWDLRKSVHKEASRSVEFGYGEDGADSLYLENTDKSIGYGPFYSTAYSDSSINPTPRDGVIGDDAIEIGEWGAYCTFAERVLAELDPEDKPGELTLLERGVDYWIILDECGFNAWILFWKDIPEDGLIKVLYSTYIVKNSWYKYVDKWFGDGGGTFIVTMNTGEMRFEEYSKPGMLCIYGIMGVNPGEVFDVKLNDNLLGVIDRNGTVCFDVESWMLDYYDDQKVQIIAGEGEDLYILGVELYIFTGSYEWITAGRDSHPVDSLGASMVTEAFDSIKNIPVMMPSLDVKEPLTPTVPFLLRKFGTGDTRADYYYSTTDKRLALKDDWSSTVPIASSNIITVGGPLSNAVTEYFNEFEEAVYRGLYGYNDFLLVPDWGSTFLGPDREWALDTTIPGVVEDDLGKAGIGIISTYKDINGTVGFVVYGYSGEDTLWTSTLLFQWNIPIFLDDGNGVLDWTDDNENGIMDPEDFTYDIKWIPKLGWCEGMWAEDDLMLGWIYYDSWGNPKWMFYPLIYWLQEENPGVVELVIKIYYEIPNTDNPYAIDEEELFSTDTHPVALIVEELGTISEKPQHPDP